MLTFGCNSSRSCSSLAKSRAMPGKHRLSAIAAREPQRKSICTSLSRASPSPRVTRRICFRQRFTVLPPKQAENIFSRPQPPRGHPRRWMHSMSSAGARRRVARQAASPGGECALRQGTDSWSPKIWSCVDGSPSVGDGFRPCLSEHPIIFNAPEASHPARSLRPLRHTRPRRWKNRKSHVFPRPQ